MTYSEKSTQISCDASIAVLVLMGDPDDIEFVPMKPRPADAKTLAELRDRWPGRGLRSIGVVGLVGAAPQIALKEPLEPGQMDTLAAAFLTYINSLLTGGQLHSPMQTDDSIAWLMGLWKLPDTRPN